MTNATPKPRRVRRAKTDGQQANEVPPAAPPPQAARPGDSGSANQVDLLTGVASSTVRIVQKAVSVIEEELALGINSTKKLEQKMVDVEKLRSADPQEVVQRFRRDAHDVVDILIDLVNVATNSLDQLTQRVIRVEVSENKTEKSAARGGGIPTLAVSTPVKAGGAVEIPMTLENESSKPTEVFYLLSSDLINTDGQRIQARQITFSPEKLVIEPQKSALITVHVSVPDNTPPGTYSGLLQATKLEQLRAVLSIRIE